MAEASKLLRPGPKQAYGLMVGKVFGRLVHWRKQGVRPVKYIYKAA